MRPPSGVCVDEPDQSVCDEESDNEDFVDTYSEESDWSAMNGEDYVESEELPHFVAVQSGLKTLLMRYQRTTGRYYGRGLDSYDGENSHFTLVHVCESHV